MERKFDGECRAAKRTVCRLKRRYQKSCTIADRKIWITELRILDALYQAKSLSYWNAKISANRSNPKKLWNSLSTILGRKRDTAVLGSSGSQDFSSIFKG